MHYGVHFHAPKAVRAAEKVGSGFALVGLQPTGHVNGYALPGVLRAVC
jgi:hypothetical protein